MKKFSLKKSLSVFFHASKVFQKRKGSLSEEDKKYFECRLSKLQEAINAKDKTIATKEAKELLSLIKKHFPLSAIKKAIHGAAMIGVALFFAIVIRQTCFEFYEIPSGSMRPTFRECDRVVVSKTQFGINIPLTPKHLTFSPEEVKRMGTVVFTAEGLDTPGVNTTYFYIFPGVKKFVKRMIGLPEDILYFYGGKIYGIDKNGKDITATLQQEKLSHIEHIPYIYINGKIKDINSLEAQAIMPSVTIEQNHIPIATLKASGKEAKGTMLQEGIEDIHELWGMGNYGMTRIVSADQLYFSKQTIDLLIKHPDTKHFLEISHHSSIKNSINFYDYRGIKRPEAGKRYSYIPLTKESLQTIWNNLYTSRFSTKKGYLENFGKSYNSSFLLYDRPKIKGGIEDATYEFLNGTAYKVKWQNDPFGLIPSLSIPEPVSNDHAFANFSESKCEILYNMGMDQSIFVSRNTHLGVAPSRYAYYRDGDLYLMGAKIFDKESKELGAFVASEKMLFEQDAAYTPFIDAGAPLLANGLLDVEKVKKYGLHIPKKSYYVLGDNHAQSGDSREFGFVPEDNLRGVTTFLLWAPGGRFGAPLQESYAWFSAHKIFVWSILFSAIGIYYLYEKRKFAFIRATKAPEGFFNKLMNLIGKAI